ncbi:MAG: hypothetical protein IT291_07465 [Deltaproteobacteria bacterium]|nr:hypothetical protein [Deltaproteobacteria bacterium]
MGLLKLRPTEAGRTKEPQQMTATRKSNGIVQPGHSDHGELDPNSILPNTDLSATVGAFETRMQRKKKQLEQANDLAGIAAKQRQALMLETMMNIRKSLVKVSRIDLGPRFYFSMDFDDWQGWPRLIVRLNDSLLQEDDYPFFQVLAYDRNSKATIEVNPGNTAKPEKIFLDKEIDLKRMPVLLKKCVRLFLDEIENIILATEKELEELESTELKAKDLAQFHENQPEAPNNDISGDLFADDEEHNNFLEQLPQLDCVEMLSENILNPELDGE